ncbi:hypothetical protein [Paenibacillus sp.]|uniref:hypothetical protein n=1 Tax=Paenibacillus sp. TaxID=58172 RepID=UPI002D47873F|nr:hypothetical protein [Paenibacillus sp.]HZG86683.1 hypothetical protein [Paenibacillus sp.]
MGQLSQITKELYYKIYKNIDNGQDYLNWSFACIDYGLEGKFVLQLASLKSTESLFIFKEYFDRAMREMDFEIPTFEECSLAYMVKYCNEILSNTSRDIFDIVKDIFNVVVLDLDRAAEYSVWLELDDGIDRIRYDDEYFKPDEEELKNRIIEEARILLATQNVEDFR